MSSATTVLHSIEKAMDDIKAKAETVLRQFIATVHTKIIELKPEIRRHCIEEMNKVESEAKIKFDELYKSVETNVPRIIHEGAVDADRILTKFISDVSRITEMAMTALKDVIKDVKTVIESDLKSVEQSSRSKLKDITQYLKSRSADAKETLTTSIHNVEKTISIEFDCLVSKLKNVLSKAELTFKQDIVLVGNDIKKTIDYTVSSISEVGNVIDNTVRDVVEEIPKSLSNIETPLISVIIWYLFGVIIILIGVIFILYFIYSKFLVINV